MEADETAAFISFALFMKRELVHGCQQFTLERALLQKYFNCHHSEWTGLAFCQLSYCCPEMLRPETQQWPLAWDADSEAQLSLLQQVHVAK